MTKRLIEIEDGLLEKARDVLGTATIRQTVATALEEAIRSGERRRNLSDGALTKFAAASNDLADEDVMGAAWR